MSGMKVFAGPVKQEHTIWAKAADGGAVPENKRGGCAAVFASPGGRPAATGDFTDIPAAAPGSGEEWSHYGLCWAR